METKINAGLVVVTKFVSSNSKEFSSYIDYIDRDTATRNENKDKYTIDGFNDDISKFQNYIDYVGNPEKTTELFTASSDKLDYTEKANLKSAFQEAQRNGSVMWQTVISFDNKWLKKHGLYDPVTGELDENKLRECTRGCMRNMLEKENLNDSSIWSAAIHYNTDNIHIHIATVEPNPTRETITQGKYAGQVRGKFKQKSIESGKSYIANEILQTSDINRKINNVIRKSIIDHKKENPLISDKELCGLFLKIYSQLPPDRRQWQYNYNTVAPARPLIDKLTTKYIQKYHPEDFKQLNALLEQQSQNYQEAYGKANKNSAFADNKIKDLYTRMGNTILKELREYDRIRQEEKLKMFKDLKSHKSISLKQYASFSQNRSLSLCMRRLKKNLNNNMREHKLNQIIYQQLQQDEQI